ncbi:MAG: hypothetical protein JWP40_4043 [Blastococcus sp.]|nr:hypothetical protein [Blastococcus sp.]
MPSRRSRRLGGRWSRSGGIGAPAAGTGYCVCGSAVDARRLVCAGMGMRGMGSRAVGGSPLSPSSSGSYARGLGLRCLPRSGIARGFRSDARRGATPEPESRRLENGVHRAVRAGSSSRTSAVGPSCPRRHPTKVPACQAPSRQASMLCGMWAAEAVEGSDKVITFQTPPRVRRRICLPWSAWGRGRSGGSVRPGLRGERVRPGGETACSGPAEEREAHPGLAGLSAAAQRKHGPSSSGAVTAVDAAGSVNEVVLASADGELTLGLHGADSGDDLGLGFLDGSGAYRAEQVDLLVEVLGGSF